MQPEQQLLYMHQIRAYLFWSSTSEMWKAVVLASACCTVVLKLAVAGIKLLFCANSQHSGLTL